MLQFLERHRCDIIPDAIAAVSDAYECDARCSYDGLWCRHFSYDPNLVLVVFYPFCVDRH